MVMIKSVRFPSRLEAWSGMGSWLVRWWRTAGKKERTAEAEYWLHMRHWFTLQLVEEGASQPTLCMSDQMGRRERVLICSCNMTDVEVVHSILLLGGSVAGLRQVNQQDLQLLISKPGRCQDKSFDRQLILRLRPALFLFLRTSFSLPF